MNKPNSSGGANPNPSGITENQNNQSPDDQSGGRSAADEHIERLLAEKKKVQEEKRELERKIKERDEADLRARGEVEKLLKLRDEELTTLKKEKAENERKEQDWKKLNAVVKSLSGELDQEYFQLIPFEQVILDESGMPDKVSVQKIAKEFEQKHTRLIDKKTGVKLPNDAAAGGAGQKITHEEWKKLPLKEMKARLRDLE